MKSPLSRRIAAVLIFFSLLSTLQAAPKNVLFIYVDDLRPELGAYGASHVHSPNIDTLASQGIVFERAYVPQAVCHPSRVATLTGARPDTNGVTDLHSDFRDRLPDIQTLPQLFKDHGYHAIPYGKIYHAPSVNDAASWSEPGAGFAPQYHDPATTGAPPFEEPTNNPPEADYADAKIASAAIQRLEDLAVDYQTNDKPFFLAVGFLKPHLPFVAPKAYWDLYDVNAMPIPTGADALPPANGVPSRLRDGFSGELQSYPTGQPPPGTNPATDIIEYRGDTRIYPDFYARQLYEGYLACVSFIDAQVGRLMDALEDPNNDGDTSDSLVDDTIIVLIGDHGFHLGENGNWPKHTNYEIANRAPLIVKAPGMAAIGAGTDSIVEFIDIYPTLAELAGLPLPDHLEGTSFAPILDDPTAPSKGFAISQYPRTSGSKDFMSYSIRTDRYHYIEWRQLDNQLVAYRELYDHQTDPNENLNIAYDPAQAALIDTLSADLDAVVGPAAGDVPGGGSEVYEGFFYPTGGLETNEISGHGFYGSWLNGPSLDGAAFCGTAIVDDSWATPSGYGWVPFGRVGTNDTSSANHPARVLSERNTIDLGTDGTRYFSFLYRPEDSGLNFRLRFYDETTQVAAVEVQNLALRLGFGAANGVGYSFTAGEDYLLVGKITGSAAGNDTIELNVYHSGDIVPATEPAFTYSRTTTSSAEIDRITFGVAFNNSASALRFDELRIDSSYESVVGSGADHEVPPIAFGATIAGTEQTGQTLTADYTWFDPNAGDTETGTLFQWQRSTDNGVTWSDIPSATGSTERPGPPEAGSIVRVAITPGSSTAPIYGLAALSTATGAIADGSVSDGLTAYWPFDDQGDPTRDVSPNDHDATLNPSNTAFVPGRYGRGLELSGSDTAQAGDIPLAGNQLSISAWVYPGSTAYSSGSWEMIVGKNWAGGVVFGVNASTNQFRFQVKLSDGSDFFAQFNDASTVIPKNTWTHVCGVRDGGTLTIYINGVEQPASFTSGASTLGIIDTTDPLYLGSHNFGGGNYWRGVIDEVRIYERALSSTEVTALNAHNPFDTGDPVSDWKNETFAGLPEGASDPQAADSVDIENDGLENLLEYAFDLNPFVDEGGVPAVDSALRFSFRRIQGSGSGTTEEGYIVAGVVYRPQISNTLESGSWNSGQTWLEEVGSPLDNGDGTETVTVRALTPETTPTGPADLASHFFRVEVSR